jgi:hypothetical protein
MGSVSGDARGARVVACFPPMFEVASIRDSGGDGDISNVDALARLRPNRPGRSDIRHRRGLPARAEHLTAARRLGPTSRVLAPITCFAPLGRAACIRGATNQKTIGMGHLDHRTREDDFDDTHEHSMGGEGGANSQLLRVPVVSPR